MARWVRRGVVAGADLLGDDVSQDQIDRALRRKRLIPLWRGVYLVGHPDPPPLGLEYAAQRFAGPTATLSDHTAGHLYALQLRPTEIIHLSLGEKRASPKGLKLHTRDLAPDEITTLHGDLRVTTIERTLLDLAHLPNLEQLVADAIRRHLTTRGKLLRMVERHPGERGVARLRRVLAGGPLWTASQAERRFIDLLRRAGLPQPESNLLTGRTMPDLVWREQRVLVELDTRGIHADWIAQRTDRRKDRERTLVGWTCLRYAVEDLRDRPFVVTSEIAAALALAGSASGSRAA